MVKVSKEEAEWIRKNFGLTKRDMIYGLDILPKDIIEILQGIQFFRGVDWPGESFAFHESIFLAITEDPKRGKHGFDKLATQVLWLISECENLEYYLLLANLKEFVKSLEKAVEQYNLAYVDDQVRDLKNELGLNQETSGLPF
jgi:hypothetical protein